MQIENGRYHIKQKLGQSRTSVTYLAYDNERRHDVTLKQFPNLWQDDTFLACFDAEMARLTAVANEALVTIYDYGLYEGQLSIASAYLDGGSLAERLATKGALTESETKQALLRIAGGLEAAHADDILHHALKPTNILFAADGNAFIADFGVVCGEVATFASDNPKYLSPEQASEQPIDERTNVYQLGTLLFEMLTGQVPFEAPSASAILHLHRYAPLPSIGQLNAGLMEEYEPVLKQMLAKDPDARFQTMGEVMEAWPSSPDIDVFAESFMIVDTPAEAVATAPVSKQPRPFWFIGVLAVLLLLIGFVFWRSQAAVAVPPTPTATAVLVEEVVPAEAETAVPPTAVPTDTATPTATATATSTMTPSPSPTPSQTATATTTPTVTPTPTITLTPTVTPTRTPIVTFTPIPEVIFVDPLPATVQNPITFSWQDNGSSAYRVRIFHVEGDFSYSSDWLTGTSWTFSIPPEEFGGWNWFVEAEEGGQSDTLFFWFDPFPNSDGDDSSDDSPTAVPTDPPPAP